MSINQAIYGAGLTGNFTQTAVAVNYKPQIIGSGEALFVQLENPRFMADNTTENQATILWGDGLMQRARLEPGEVTELLPVKRLAEIYARTLPETGVDEISELIVTIFY